MGRIEPMPNVASVVLKHNKTSCLIHCAIGMNVLIANNTRLWSVFSLGHLKHSFEPYTFECLLVTSQLYWFYLFAELVLKVFCLNCFMCLAISIFYCPKHNLTPLVQRKHKQLLQSRVTTIVIEQFQ